MSVLTQFSKFAPRNPGDPAVLLLSGGLDSVTILAMIKALGYTPYALSVSYGQRHSSELDAAIKIAHAYGVRRHEIIDLDLRRFGGSALTDTKIDVPIHSNQQDDALGKSNGGGGSSSVNDEIPITYVPARNTILLSTALGWMEALGGRDIFFGANAVDYSGYPDCRPAYVKSFEDMANLATRIGVQEHSIRVHAPIIDLNKAQIIQVGMALGVDYAETVSCYQANTVGQACGVCESCRLRQTGFLQAGIVDPTLYQSSFSSSSSSLSSP